jgi:hypothetical protein
MLAKKRQDPNQPHKLSIFIESAYQADSQFPAPVGKGKPMQLSVVLGEVWEKTL